MANYHTGTINIKGETHTIKNRKVALTKDFDLEQHLKEYYVQTIPKSSPHLVETYDEALKCYSDVLHKRIQVQLKLAKEAAKRDEVNVALIPMVFKIKTPMTAEQMKDFMGQSDDDKPMSLWLKKRGWVWMTSFLTHDPKQGICMLVATLVPKQ